MATSRSRKLFVNLPVKDLKRSKEFFAKLGFEFNPQFSDDKAACMVVSEESCVMLLVEEYFKGFTRKPIADSRTLTEALFCISANSRAEVDELVKTAVESGGAPAADKQDLGSMYGWSFFDPDGHHWEVMYMDPAALAK